MDVAGDRVWSDTFGRCSGCIQEQRVWSAFLYPAFVSWVPSWYFARGIQALMGEEYEQEEVLFCQQFLRTNLCDETRFQEVIPHQSHELNNHE
jgi:hypothetical protein